MKSKRRSERRRRALRAAQAVTFSLALGAGAAGCSMTHNPDPDVDAGPDLTDAGYDAGPVDCSSSPWPDTEECCEMFGGFWSPGGGCAVPGPFVPPDLPA